MSEQSLLDVQRSAGAVFSDDDSRVLHFGDPQSEYAAARNESVLFALSDRTQIEITGADGAKFLHNFCTNDILGLEPGQGCEAFVTNVKGRVLGHVFVFVGEESIWLETVPDSENALISHLDRYIITEDVALHGRSAECGELFVSGPQATDLLGRLFVSDSLDTYAHVSVQVLQQPASVRRVDLLGQVGFLLSRSRHLLADTWNILRDNGMRPAGTAAFDALRIEAGTPLYGVDISDGNLAQEVARAKVAISFTKGCYQGQEPIARIDALGHVNRELRGLKLTTGPVPPSGSQVMAANDQKEIGTVTSAALSYEDDNPVALAYLRSQFVTPGTSVAVLVKDQLIPATVFWPDWLLGAPDER